MFVFFISALYIAASVMIVIAIGGIISITVGVKHKDPESVMGGAVAMMFLACTFGGFAAFLQWMLG